MARLPVGIYADTRRRITCVACQRNAEAHSDKLCIECAKERDGLEQHCVEDVANYRRHVDRTWYELEQAIPDDLKSPLYERWCTYQQAITEGKPEAAKVEAMARAGRQDPLLDLIRIWLAYTDAKAVYQERERWADQVYQAIGELDKRS